MEIKYRFYHQFVVDKNKKEFYEKIEIYKGGLDTNALYKKWYDEIKDKNLGAFITFSGIIRDDDNVEALSFDIYEALCKIGLTIGKKD